MLDLLNEILEEKNKEIASKYGEERYPIYFIVAQPRGASTLLQQLLISNLEIGYISNFLAKFYKAPLFGLELEKYVIDKEFKSTFLSSYGNTKGVSEPHEWGWFWQNMLDLKEKEHYSKLNDFTILKNNINAIANIKKLPLIIDNVFALSNLLKFKHCFKKIRIINLTRDLYFVSNSIINARLSRYNDINRFYGHFPRNIKEILKIENPIEQIVFQVKSIQNEIDEILESFDSRDIITIDYEDIYNDSLGVVDKFHDFVKTDGINLNYKEKHIPTLTYRNDESFISPQYKNDLDFYYKKYFGNKND